MPDKDVKAQSETQTLKQTRRLRDVEIKTYGQSHERQRRRVKVGQSTSRDTEVETEIRDKDIEKGT